MSTKVTHAEHCEMAEPTDSPPPPVPASAAASAANPGNGIGIDDHALLRMAATVPDLPELVQGAQRAAAFEHALTLTAAVRVYGRAMLFSMIMSLAIIMEGYDTSLLSSFYGYPAFQKRFGQPLADGSSYQISARWQSGLANGSQVGQILGLVASGLLADRFGYRATILGALALMVAFIFVLVFAQNVGMLFAGSVLCGLPWGAFQTLTTTYAADVSPTVLRPYLTTYVNLCWVVGQLVAIGVVRGLLGRADDWSWRIPYAVQWVWPVPIIVAVVLAPESPWWLVRQGRLDDAKAALRRLSAHPAARIDDALALIVLTNEQEKLHGAGVSYWDCVRGTDRRRTEIACAAWVVQVSCGIYFAFNIVYFLEQAGFAPDKAFDFGVGINAVGFVGTLLSWWVMRYVGRRTLYIGGLSALCVLLLAVGFLAIPSFAAGTPQYSAIGYASGALLVVWIFVYDMSVGPVCYSIVAEIPSTRLRIKTVVLARTCYNIVAIGVIFLNPAILNPTAWDLKGKGGFIWGGICFVGLVWTYFRLPEPRGRTPAELDVLFEQNVSARKFAATKVDLFLDGHHMDVLDKAAEAQM
ncbi:MFS transporter, SP family, general alpha glucoside:H+ symporter [Sporothrix schenckii 1099-18]|uniref:MFS transporter, SP family, general alpha glucoside:H+ symporter n=1 Tax=Sporothrix schenckii 1099-18 TaxID=1397361 RepID=A0A0F2MCR2_SPOSC|nr:MFS transporter, SP family, general alpha glucoside:H+ symporter [Sporothrix schenckii 1099-18]KJR87468.1 MFS transporter, SP family, general alpha glucoside:H+ symporter [Sporothrix schenckii 1099-18]